MPHDTAPIVSLPALLEKLARAHRILALNGHVNMSLGHMSLRDPEGRGFWLKRSGLGFEEVGKDDFVLLDFDGQHIAGSGGRHSEWPIHAGIYKARPDIMCVAHSHPFQSTVFSATDAELGCVCHEGVMLYDKVAYHRRTRGLIRTADQGREMAELLGAKNVVLMKNHGMTSCGPSIEMATLFAIFLERASAAHLLVAASQLPWSGPELEELTEGGAARLELPPPAIADLWNYFDRQLSRHEIGQAS